jgi:hypothetical protein
MVSEECFPLRRTVNSVFKSDKFLECPATKNEQFCTDATPRSFLLFRVGISDRKCLSSVVSAV